MSNTPKDRFPALFQMLEQMYDCVYDDVRGVMRIDSGKDGPVVGISACTHGNEPSGLAAISCLINGLRLKERLLKGSVFLVVNNLEAANRYFNTPNQSKACRYVDVNMNRLPEDLIQRTGDLRCEVVRARELLKIWQQFEVGLDFHSTTQHTAPMIISAGDAFHQTLYQGMPVSIIITNIDIVQIGLPAFGFFGRGAGSDTSVFEVECGQHEDPSSHLLAYEAATTLLRNLDMIGLDLRGEPVESEIAFQEYQVFGKVVFPNKGYRLVRSFDDFEFIEKGTLLARGDGVRIVAEEDCHTIFCKDSKSIATWADTSEEAMFLSRPVRFRV